MTRVRVLIRSLVLGGAEKQATLLALALRDDHDTGLLVLGGDPHPRHLAFLEEHRLRATFLGGARLARPLALRRLLARERVEALFCFLPSDSVLGALAGRAAGVERIHCGLRNARLAPRKELALRLAHNHLADLTLSNSYAAAEYFGARGFAPEKLVVVPNGIFVTPRPPVPPSGGPVTLLTAARFVEEKDHDVALRALRRLLDAGGAPAGLRHVIAGGGPLEARLRARVAELGLGDVVRLVVDPPDMAALFAGAHVYVSTSRFEGLSNSIMEAMNAGLPVVATDVGDNARLVRDGVSGRIVPVGDEAALADALDGLVRSAETRVRQGAEGHRLLAEGYSFERFRQRHLELLDR